MNATDPEQLDSGAPLRPLISSLLLAAGLVLLIAGCVEEPLPQRRSNHGDCLLNLKLSELPEALRRCNRVVASFPGDPVPLNDRFLIHSLAGNNTAACEDIRRAAQLARRKPAAQLDSLLRKNLEQRLASCSD